jgi:AcrR family transcriptional regulator
MLLLVANAEWQYDSAYDVRSNAYGIRNNDRNVNPYEEVAMTEGEGETGLPASIEYAWGLRARPAKGPKRGLSVERIVEAGIAIAESEGIGAVSMGRIAAELDSKPMSLYRYFASKDDLITLMIDAALAPPSPIATSMSWRQELTHWCCQYRDALQRHPWVLRVPISGPPVTPNQLLFLEDGLQALRDTTLREDEKMSVLLLLSGFVRNEATLIVDINAAAASSGKPARDIMPLYGRMIRRLVDEERFPGLQRVIAAGVFDQDDNEDDEFHFGLERILDGVDLLMRSRS